VLQMVARLLAALLVVTTMKTALGFTDAESIRLLHNIKSVSIAHHPFCKILSRTYVCLTLSDPSCSDGPMLL